MKYYALFFLVAGAFACATSTPLSPPLSTASQSEAKAPARSYESLVKIARLYCDSGKPKKAIKPLNQAIEMQPQRPDAYGVLGYSLAMQKKLKQSAQAYEKARSLGSQQRRLFQELSSVYDVQKEYQKAAKVYRDWIELNPDDTEMKHELSLSLLLINEFQESILLLQEITAKEDASQQARVDLAYAYARSGDHARALPLVRKLFVRGLPYGLLVEFLQTYEKPKSALIFFDEFARKPLDQKLQKLRKHLVKLTKGR